MYKTNLAEVITVAAREKAYRESAAEVMLSISESNDMWGSRVERIILEKSDMLDSRTYELVDLLFKDYTEKYMYPCYRLFINEDKPKTITTEGLTTDFLLIEFNVEDKDDVWFSIYLCKTLEELESEIMDRGSLEDISQLIVLEKGEVKDFIIEPCRCCLMPTVSWLER